MGLDEQNYATLDQLKDALDMLAVDWPDIMRNDCIPLDIALPLTDNTSVPSYNDFQSLKQKLKQSLKVAVNDNYMAFNDSIGSYGISIETLNQSQTSLTDIRENLTHVDKLLSAETSIMRELNEKRKESIQVLEILEKINDLQKKLDELNVRIDASEFDKAVSLVQEITQIVDDNHLADIDGFQTYQQKLNSSVTVLLDALINEIDSNIYSKDVNTMKYVVNNQTNRVPLQKGLLGFIKTLNDEMIDEEDDLAVRTGRFDDLLISFKRVKKISKQSECLARLTEYSEREIRRVIQRSIDEIRQKYPSHIKLNSTSDSMKSPLESFDIVQGMNGMIITDVFELIFPRILALTQKHIAIYHISMVDGYNYNIDSIWSEVQKQLSLIIFNYIIDEDVLDHMEELDAKNSKQTADSPFVKLPKQFDMVKKGPIFEFAKLSLESISSNLVDPLSSIFPQNAKAHHSEESSNLNKDEARIFIGTDDINESKRYVLVNPNIFNMGYIIDNFISFVNNVKLSFNSDGSEGAVDFFEEFMDLVFVSQLENTLEYQFDCLSEKRWVSDHLLEASNYIKMFFNKVLILLDTTLYYRPSYVQIIFKLFDRMIQNFADSMENLLKVKDTKILARWVSDPKLKIISNKIVDTLIENSGDSQQLDILVSNELVHALSIAGNFIPTINPNNFLTLDHMRSLVDLLAALSNIVNWLPTLKVKVPDFLETVELTQKMKETWSLGIFDDSGSPAEILNTASDDNYTESETNNEKYVSQDVGNEVVGYLAVDLRAGERFEKLVEEMTKMMNNAEILIRYEIRIECIWYMIQMMINKQWEQEGDESVDLGVDKFCERINNINRIFNKVSKNIISDSRDEVKTRLFGGLSFWIDKLAVFESRRISIMGKSGWMKMIVNLKVLQQAIMNIDSDTGINVGLAKMRTSLRYFTIGNEGDKFLQRLDKVNQEQLNLGEEDWKNLIRLIFSQKLAKDNVGNYNKKFMAAQAGLLKGLSVK